MNEGFEPNVSADGMDKMVAPFAVHIAVAAGDDDFKFMIGYLDARSSGQGSPVQAVENIGLSVMGEFRSLPNTRNQHQLFPVYARFFDGPVERVEDRKVSTPRTPRRLAFTHSEVS